MPDLHLHPGTLLPPTPAEMRGWGRLKRIARVYPTAPIELLCAIGATWRGFYVARYAGEMALPYVPAVPPWVLACVMGGLGALQLYGCIWERGHLRALAAIGLAMMFTWLVTVYAEVPGIWDTPASAIPMFYALLSLGELWVAARTPALLPWVLRYRARTSGPWRVRR